MYRAAAMMTVSYIAAGIAVSCMMVAMGLAATVFGAAALIGSSRKTA